MSGNGTGKRKEIEVWSGMHGRVNALMEKMRGGGKHLSVDC